MSSSKPKTQQVASPTPDTSMSQVKPPVLPLDDKGRPYQTQETLDQDAAYQASRTDLGQRKVW